MKMKKDELNLHIKELCVKCKFLVNSQIGSLKKPASNSQIRSWYNAFMQEFSSNFNDNHGFSLEEQAYISYKMRHEARMHTRDFMKDNERSILEARDEKTYGNKDGPTFEYLINKNKNELDIDNTYRKIISSSTKTNKWVNLLNETGLLAVYDSANNAISNAYQIVGSATAGIVNFVKQFFNSEPKNQLNF